MNKNIVGLVHSKGFDNYPSINNFNPSFSYPEYLFNELSNETNYVYEAVRDLFFQMELDKENYDKDKWNPLKDIVEPGSKVVLKPNMVLHFNSSGEDLNAVVSHGAVLRAIADYILIALKGKGEILICDAPQMNCDFDKLIELNGFKSVLDFYREKYGSNNIKISLLDLRKEKTIYKHGIVWERIALKQDPLGYKIIDLDKNSEVIGIDHTKLYGADYQRGVTVRAHSHGHHVYSVSASVLDSDVFISIPKMKTHRKAGVTLSLKNIVGISGDKNYLTHYRIRAPKYGGDEFSDVSILTMLDRTMKDLVLSKYWGIGKYPFALWNYLKGAMEKISISEKKIFTDGDWFGNDTVWRMALDLNKIILYADKNGNMTDSIQRKYLSIIDGFISGEKEGPLGPSPFKSAVVIGGFDPILTDVVATKVMGLDADKIPLMVYCWNPKGYKLTTFRKDEIKIKSNEALWVNILEDNSIVPFKFTPPEGWKGKFELNSDGKVI